MMSTEQKACPDIYLERNIKRCFNLYIWENEKTQHWGLLLGYLYLCQNYVYCDTCISVKITSIGIPVSLSKLRLLGYLYLCQNDFYWDTCISVKFTSIGIPVPLSYYFYWIPVSLSKLRLL